MNYFFRCTAAILVAVMVCMVLQQQGKDFSLLISIAVCCMILTAGASFLGPILDFISDLVSVAQLDESLVRVLYKAVGIGILSEIVSLICADTGNASMGKALNILASAVILWLSIPVFQALLDLIRDILEQV